MKVPAVIVVVLVAVNLLASRTTLAWDLTRSGVNTLAAQSVLAAQRLDADLLVIGLFRAGPGNGQATAESLVGLYQAQTARVIYRSESFDGDMADVRSYSVREPNTLVLDYRGKTQQLTQALQTEPDFTAAVLKLDPDWGALPASAPVCSMMPIPAMPKSPRKSSSAMTGSRCT